MNYTDHKETILIVVSLFLIFIFFFSYINKMETADYHTLTSSITADEMSEIQSLRREAFNQAIKCGERHEQNFEDVMWHIYPDRLIIFEEGNKKLELAGWYDSTNNSIWVAYPFRKTAWVLLHESLHAQGWRGHPDHPFRTCRARVEDH